MANINIQLLAHGCFPCHAEWRIQLHEQRLYRLYYVLGGDAWYKSESQSFKFAENTLYLLPQDTFYEMWHDPQNPLVILWFDINIFPCGDSNVISLIPEAGTPLKTMIDTAILMHKQSLPWDEYEMICKLILSQIDMLYPFKSISDERIAIALRYIDTHISDDLSCTRLASIAGFERSYFTRRFTQEIGIAPSEYVRAKRMGTATQLLKTNTVKRTSELLGYDDEKSFTRAFKAFTGHSPSKCKGYDCQKSAAVSVY